MLHLKGIKLLLCVLGGIAVAGIAGAATYVIGQDALPSPTYAIDTNSVAPVKVDHPDHTLLSARQVLKNMGITRQAVGAEIHIYAPGGSLNKHQHENRVHMFYILEGTGDFTIGNDTYRARPGTMLYLPERTPHSMKVMGDKNLVYVWFSGPAPTREQ